MTIVRVFMMGKLLYKASAFELDSIKRRREEDVPVKETIDPIDPPCQ